jgi:hypothetical protein
MRVTPTTDATVSMQATLRVDSRVDSRAPGRLHDRFGRDSPVTCRSWPCWRRITDNEITAIAREPAMHRRQPINSADLGVELTRVTNEMPSPHDIEHVQNWLASGGHHGAPSEQPPTSRTFAYRRACACSLQAGTTTAARSQARNVGADVAGGCPFRRRLNGLQPTRTQWWRSLAINLSFVRPEYPDIPSSLARFFSCGTVQSA